MKRFTSTFSESGNGDCETRSWLAPDAKTAAKYRGAIELLGLGYTEHEVKGEALFHVTVNNDHKGVRVSKELRTKDEVTAIIDSVLGLFHRFGKDKQALLQAFFAGNEIEFFFEDGVSDRLSVTRAILKAA